MIALDTSAVLALLFQETGGFRVASAVASGDSLMSTVNLAETLAAVERHGSEPTSALQLLRTIGLAFVPYDEEQALQTAALEAAARDAGLSLGGRACLAPAIRERCGVLTADRTWARLDLPVRVELIR